MQEVISKWTKALRSGIYKQGQLVLRSEQNHYCCLGVLCDVMGTKWEMGAGKYITATGDAYDLTRLVRESIGLTRPQEDELIKMNDRQGKSFSQIADWIEANVQA